MTCSSPTLIPRLETVERNLVSTQEGFERKLKEDMELARKDLQAATQGQLEARARRISECEAELERVGGSMAELQTK